MNRPGIPHAPGRDRRWVATVDERAEVLAAEQERPRKCHARRADLTNINPCNARADVLFAAPAGSRRSPEPRCGNHLDGGWIEHGVVMRWELESTGDDREDRR